MKLPILIVWMLSMGLLATSGWRLASSYQEHASLSEGLARAHRAVGRIKALRQQPDRVASESRTAQALARIIEESATSSGLKPAQILSIEPQSFRRVKDTECEEHATLVRLEGLSLPQLAQLAAQLRRQANAQYPLHITALRVTAPYQALQGKSASAELWNVELTLTYFVYSPKNRSS